jgi:hypothetical protein
VDYFTIRWTGWVEALYTETYTFYLNSDDSSRMNVSGQMVINPAWSYQGVEKSGSIALTAGVKYGFFKYFINI